MLREPTSFRSILANPSDAARPVVHCDNFTVKTSRRKLPIGNHKQGCDYLSSQHHSCLEMVLLHGSVKSFLHIMAAAVTSLLNWSRSHLVWRCESETQPSHSLVPFRPFLCLLIISGFTHSTYLLCVCMSDYSDPSVPAVDSDVFANTIEQHCLNHSRHSFHIFHQFKLPDCVLQSF